MRHKPPFVPEQHLGQAEVIPLVPADQPRAPVRPVLHRSTPCRVSEHWKEKSSPLTELMKYVDGIQMLIDTMENNSRLYAPCHALMLAAAKLCIGDEFPYSCPEEVLEDLMTLRDQIGNEPGRTTDVVELLNRIPGRLVPRDKRSMAALRTIFIRIITVPGSPERRRMLARNLLIVLRIEQATEQTALEHIERTSIGTLTATLK